MRNVRGCLFCQTDSAKLKVVQYGKISNRLTHFCPFLIYFVILLNLTTDWVCPNYYTFTEVSGHSLRTGLGCNCREAVCGQRIRNRLQLEVGGRGHMWNFSTLRSPAAEKLSGSFRSSPAMIAERLHMHHLWIIVCLHKACA